MKTNALTLALFLTIGCSNGAFKGGANTKTSPAGSGSGTKSGGGADGGSNTDGSGSGSGATSGSGTGNGKIGENGADYGDLIATSANDITLDAASCKDHGVTPAELNARCDDDWVAMGVQYTQTFSHLDSLHCCQVKYGGAPIKKLDCADLPISTGKFVMCPKNTFLAGLKTTDDATPTAVTCCSYTFDAQHRLAWGDLVKSGLDFKGQPIDGVISYSDGKVYTCPDTNQIVGGIGDNLVPDNDLDNFDCYKLALRKP